MKDIVKNLEDALSSMSDEELDAEFKKLEHWHNVGPTCEEYFAFLDQIEAEKISCIKDI